MEVKGYSDFPIFKVGLADNKTLCLPDSFDLEKFKNVPIVKVIDSNCLDVDYINKEIPVGMVKSAEYIQDGYVYGSIFIYGEHGNLILFKIMEYLQKRVKKLEMYYM